MLNGKAGRAAEFGCVFIGLPIFLALALPPDRIPAAFLVFCLIGLVLLGLTPGFHWRDALHGWRGFDLGFVLVVTGSASAALLVFAWWLVPEQIFFLPRRLPDLWLMILAFYPWFSALPQEILFRVLFFRRYGSLFPAQGLAVGVNGAVFGLAHLVYWNWVAVGLSALGGIVLARAYLRHGGLAAAFLLHALFGMAVFTVGLGVFFYHGAIPSR